MGFMKYVSSKTQSFNPGSVRIVRNGMGYNLFIHRADIRDLFGDKCFVELFYDPDTKQVGILPRDKKDAGCLRVNKATGQVSLSGFMNHFGLSLPVEGVVSYRVENGLMIFSWHNIQLKMREQKLAAA